MRRTALARVSKKRRADHDEYERVVQRVLLRDQGCRAARRWPEVGCKGRLDPHHIKLQNIYPELRCDPENILTICRAHHDALHAHPKLAKERGLLA